MAKRGPVSNFTAYICIYRIYKLGALAPGAVWQVHRAMVWGKRHRCGQMREPQCFRRLPSHAVVIVTACPWVKCITLSAYWRKSMTSWKNLSRGLPAWLLNFSGLDCENCLAGSSTHCFQFFLPFRGNSCDCFRFCQVPFCVARDVTFLGSTCVSNYARL